MTFLPEHRYRLLNGSDNNIRNFNLGRTGENLIRQASPAYADGIAAPAHPDLPNPRLISNTLSNQTESIPDRRNLSSFIWTWGQFITHDLMLTSNQQGNSDRVESLNITIPEGDLVYQPGSIIPVTRTMFDPSTGSDPNNPRQHINNVTAWLDGSMIYGSDPQRANWLRSFEGGKLKVSSHQAGDLLPRLGSDVNAPNMDRIQENSELFVAGDARANENPALTSLHTLFVREHNRVAEIIDSTHNDLPTDSIERDEEIYQRTRKIINAQIQSITYNEFLPALGVTLDPYNGYNSNVNASISNEFATLGFRMGHSQSSDIIPIVGSDGNSIGSGELDFAQASFDPSVITEVGGIEPILLGLVTEIQQATDLKIVDSLRNIIFPNSNSNSPIANGTDLFAIDIQRGRDRGLPTYNDIREAYGLDRVSSFEEITSDSTVVENLETLYVEVDRIDPLIGMLAEGQLAGASIGELNEAILEDQFERSRNGDRFWYENDSDFALWNAPELDSNMMASQWLSQLSLSDVIELNSSIDIFPDDPFFATQSEDSTI